MDKENDKEQGHQEIDHIQCPVCKSYDTVVGGIGQQAIVDGTLPPEAIMFASTMTGACPPKMFMDKLPMGTKGSTYMIGVAVCKKCGSLRAAKIVIDTGTKRPTITLPGGRQLGSN